MEKPHTAARLWALGCAAVLGLWAAPQAFAADDPDPAITLTTCYYDYADVSNLFTICMDVDQPTYIVVDCGFGPVEYELEPSQDGTWIPCTVNSDGVVRMWIDQPELINYFYCQGGHITDIDLSKLTTLQVLDLSNNDLKKIDLSNNKELGYLDLGSNLFDEVPLNIGPLPKLEVLEIENVGNISPDFNMSDYPELLSFAAFSSKGLTNLDPSGCPKLQRLAADVTGISTIDVSKNPVLKILNISDTFVTSVDLSNNPELQQLYIGHQGRYAENFKFSSLDVSNNPKLVYLFAQNNNLKTIDLSKNPALSDLNLQKNVLESIDLSGNPNLGQVDISDNYLDFATLPLGRNFPLQYYYSQRPMPVASSFPVGESLDLSAKVLREGTETLMQLFGVSQRDITNPELLSEDYYEYKDGVVKFKKEYPDSVYASFSNASFPECVLTTTSFMVKTPEQYGVPVRTLSFSPAAAEAGSDLAFGLGVTGASMENPRTVFVDFGDGVRVPVTVDCQIPDAANIVGKRAGSGSVAVYVNDGDLVSALSIDAVPLYGIDLENAPSLRSLSLTATDLRFIDLTWQRCLEVLKLTGNRFGSLDLTTDILGYNKNVLHTIDVSDNQLESMSFTAESNIKHLNVSHNMLSELAFDKAYDMLSLDLSYNNFTSVSVENLDSLQVLNVAGNHLSALDKPWQNTLRYLDCRDNDFTFASLPYRPGELPGEYLYAPQNAMKIAGKGPSCNLAKVGLYVDNVTTEFVLHKADGSVLTEGVDYELRGALVVFKDYSLGKVYCTMTNPVFPDLTLTTTEILVAEPPTEMLGWMHVAKDTDSDHEVFLSLAGANDGDTLYIDWNGDGNDFTEYILKTTYTLFPVTPVAGKFAKIYGYDSPEFLTVFSMSGVPLQKADFSNMKGVNTFDVSYSGCKDIDLPVSENLISLGLNGNGLKSIDCPGMEKLTYLSADDNDIKSIDLSQFPKLQVLALRRNGMNDIKLDNPDLWFLGLAENDFEEFSFAGLPSLDVADLSYCGMKRLDINGPRSLGELYIVGNEFTFQTLPIVPSSVRRYYYTEQAHVPAVVNGLTVDLSSQAMVGDVPTSFIWCVDEPYYDAAEGQLYAETLTNGVDFTVSDGVTTFFGEQANVCCLMMNEVFPYTFLLTDLLTITSSGVDAAVANAAAISIDGRTLSISAEDGTEFAVYAADGKTVAAGKVSGGSVKVELPAAGVYVVKAGRASMKLAVS